MMGWLKSTQSLNWKTLKVLVIPIMIIVASFILIFGPIGPYKEYPEINQLTVIEGELDSIDENGPELSIKLKNNPGYFFVPAKLKEFTYVIK